MGAIPEHKVENSGGIGDPVAWISRDHAPIERIPGEHRATPAGDREAPIIVSHPASDAGSTGRRRWMLSVLAVVVALAVTAAVWMSRASTPSAVTTLRK